MENITDYKQLFSTVATHTNQAFLALLLDFFNAIGEDEREKFFYDNRKNMDTLVWYYRRFKNKFYQAQREKIKDYYFTICDKTGTDKWWLFSYGRVLGVYLKEDAPRIGIECAFKDETCDNELGKFHISVATWDKPDFGLYKQDMEKYFPYSPIDDKSVKNRLFLPIAAITPEGNKDVIISILEKTYNTLKGIIDKHK